MKLHFDPNQQFQIDAINSIVGFVTFKSQAGLNSFNLTPRKWIEATNAIGIISKAGRYGGEKYGTGKNR